MNKKIITAAFIAFMTISATSFAQSGEKPNKMAMNEKMYDSLGLNQQQKENLKALNDDGRKQMEAIRNDAALSDDQKKDKMKELRKTQKTKRDAILTPEQTERYEAWMETNRKKRQH